MDRIELYCKKTLSMMSESHCPEADEFRKE